MLYSAGQAASTPKGAQRRDWLTNKSRDPRVVLVGDSGGYQIQQGTIDFTPDVPARMLRWLEQVADYSMTLDFPLGRIEDGALTEHILRLRDNGHDVEAEARRHGFSPDYMACLIQTELNNRLFETERNPGATAFLNVIQGRNEAESAFWYSRVKDFAFEGWAFAGLHHTQISMTLRRLLQMYDDGSLQDCKWIHFLGISTLKAGMVLSFLQRALHETKMAPNVQISFDSASPVKAAAQAYEAILGFDPGKDRWSFKPARISAVPAGAGHMPLNGYAHQWSSQGQGRIPVNTFIGRDVRIRNLLSQKADGRLTIASDQMTLLIHHNTQAYIEGFRKAYRYLDEKSVLDRPKPLRQMQTLINAALTDKSGNMLEQCADELDALMYEQV